MKEKGSVQKCTWSLDEDQVLLELVRVHGPKKWSVIAAALPGRIGKQCRERWHNHLNPEVRKDAWTLEEDAIIFDLVEKMGTKWASIAKQLHGRTDNSIKNRYYSSLKKIHEQKRNGTYVAPAPPDSPESSPAPSMRRKSSASTMVPPDETISVQAPFESSRKRRKCSVDSTLSDLSRELAIRAVTSSPATNSFACDTDSETDSVDEAFALPKPLVNTVYNTPQLVRVGKPQQQAPRQPRVRNRKSSFSHHHSSPKSPARRPIRPISASWPSPPRSWSPAVESCNSEDDLLSMISFSSSSESTSSIANQATANIFESILVPHSYNQNVSVVLDFAPSQPLQPLSIVSEYHTLLAFM